MVRKNIGWVFLGLAILFVGFLPATRVPIIGDDFYVIYQAQGMSKGDVFAWISLAWGWGMQAGHFNPIGQVLGGLYHFISMPLTSALNISPAYYYQGGAFALLLLAVISATYFFVQTLKTLELEITPGSTARYFALVAAITGLTIQIHPWSNDPVTTYSMAGYGSTAVGFLLLGLAMKAIRPNSHPVWMTVKVSLVAVFSVVYYELLVAAVAGAAVIFAAGLLKKLAITTVSKKRIVALLGFGVVLPAIVFLGGRAYVSLISGTGGYTGTVVGGPLDGVKTFAFSLISAVPGGAWPYSFYRVNPMILSRPAFLAGTVLVALLIIFAIAWFRTAPAEPVRHPRKIGIPLLALIVFWWLSTAAQAFTAKYIAEITAPGLVYLFYPIGMLTMSLIIAGFAVQVSKKRLLTVGAIFLAFTTWFGMTQQTINWTLSIQMESAYRLNSELAAATTNSRIDEEQRCARLERWLEREWPEYYREGVLANLEPTYYQLKGEEFCSTDVANAPAEAK